MDPISDMIVRIKNAVESKKESVVFPYSKLKLAITDVLFKNGYAKSYGKKGKKIAKFIEMVFVINEHGNKIHGLKRVSKNSKRIYQKAKDLKKVKGGYGSLIISTPKGIMTDKMAKEANMGGEALFKIW